MTGFLHDPNLRSVVGLARAVGYHGGMDENPYEWPPLKKPDVPPGPLPGWRRCGAILMLVVGAIFLHAVPDALVLVARHKEAETGFAALIFYVAFGCFFMWCGVRLVWRRAREKVLIVMWLGVPFGLLVGFLISLFSAPK